MDFTDFSWQGWQPKLQATLCFVVDRKAGKILLMRKKRGLGKGKINAPGGKLDPGESLLECAVRETQEELNIEALEPSRRGTLWFQFTDGLAMEVGVFLAEKWHGEPTETEEGAPCWYPINAIPYEEMWQDDRYWLPDLLANRHFKARFFFHEETILTAELQYAQKGEV